MMKIRNLLIIILTLALAWLLPAFYHMFSTHTSGRLFVYYSAVTEHFCVIGKNAQTDEIERKDIVTGEQYALQQFDSILPLLYYRQLLADGKMPDTIQGKAISAKQANDKSFFFRYKPEQKNSPAIALYPLFESASGRVDLKMPEDVFRLGKELAFLVPETNEIDTAKTRIFHAAFVAAHFTFPAQQVAGNPSPRKPYDEGYFVIDAQDRLFHLKMIKGVPFLKEVQLPETFIPSFFAPFEPDDRSFYGFLFNAKGEVYILNTHDYKVQKLDCGQVDLDENFLVIMGNPLYWTVRLIAHHEEKVFAFTAESKECVAQHQFAKQRPPNEWNRYLFPFELKWTNPLSKYVLPQWKWGHWEVLLINFLFAFLFGILRRHRVSLPTIFTVFLWILATGIFGFVALLLLRERES